MGLSVCLFLGCDKPPVAPSPGMATVKVPPPPAVTASASASASEPEEAAVPTLPMYPVGRVYSLLDVQMTSGGPELRIGYDGGMGSGLSRAFRYVPLVKGVPDFTQETSDAGRASSTGGFDELVGKRPNLVLHLVSGFRSAAYDGYGILGANNEWDWMGAPDLPGTGEGLFLWTKDRLLEWRGPQLEQMAEASLGTRLPKLRVFQGKDKTAPTLPASLQKRLTAEGFSLGTFTVLRTGEVMAIGYLTKGNGFGTVLWTDDVKQPSYFVTVFDGVMETTDLHIVGGTTLANLRLRIRNRILRLEGSSWVVESTVPPGGLPDVWFGSTLVLPHDFEAAPEGTPDAPPNPCPPPMRCEAFARTAKDAPWLPIAILELQASPITYVVDAEGTIWGVEGEMLVSSKKPAETFEVTEETLVLGRKRSLLRGGSMDATGNPPDQFAQRTCRMHHVLLDRSPVAKAPSDYPKIRAALKGHPEFAGAKFIVSREGDWQFFGAQVADEALADKLAVVLRKAAKTGSVLCAEPVATQEIKIDLKTGERLP
jgi:hypothetical protein